MTIHVLARCVHFEKERNSFAVAAGIDIGSMPEHISLSILRCSGDGHSVTSATVLCKAIDKAASAFWAGNDHP